MPPQPSSKPRVVKDYDKLDEAVAEQIKLAYPRGYHKHLVKFKNAKGDEVSALPFETDDRYYLVRMTVKEARAIIADDDDYDDDGNLRSSARREYVARHADDDEVDDEDDLADELGADDDDDFGDDDYAAALADGAPEDDDDELRPGDDEDDTAGGGPRQVSLDGIDVVDPGTV